MQDLVADVLVATHLVDMTEILIQGNDGEDHAPHMVEVDRVPQMRGGETIILTHIGDAGTAPCLLVAVATTQDRIEQINSIASLALLDYLFIKTYCGFM